MAINKIVLETDGLVVGDNQLAASGGGVYIDKSLSVNENISGNNVTGQTVNANTISSNTATALTYNANNLFSNYASVGLTLTVGNTTITSTRFTAGREFSANSDLGQLGYVLTSAGPGNNVYWTALPAVVGINSGRAIAMALVFGT